MLNKLLPNLFFTSARNAIVVFILKIGGIASSYLFAILVSKFYGPKGFGIFSLCLGIATFGLLFGKVGFDTALLKYAAVYKEYEERGNLSKVFRKSLRFTIPICLLVLALIVLFAKFLSNQFSPSADISFYLTVISLSVIPHVFILIISEGLRGLGQTNKYIFLQNIGIYLFCSLAILIHFFLKLPVQPFWMVVVIYDCDVVAVLAIALYWWIPLFYKAHPATVNISTSEIFKISVPMFWSNAMFVIINWTDTLMLGKYSTDIEVGIYNAALRISNLVALPLFVITSIAAPKFASAYANNDLSGLKNTVSRSTQYIFLLTLPLFVAIMCFPSFFMNLFGSDYQSGAIVLMILITGQFLKSLCGSTDFLLQMTGNEKTFQNIILLSMGLNVGLNFLLIPTFGSRGAAISNALTMVTWNIIAVYFIKNRLNINAMFNLSILKVQYNRLRKGGFL